VSPPQHGVPHEDFDAMLSEALKPTRPRTTRRDD
jgi:hypothetical protein